MKEWIRTAAALRLMAKSESPVHQYLALRLLKQAVEDAKSIILGILSDIQGSLSFMLNELEREERGLRGQYEKRISAEDVKKLVDAAWETVKDNMGDAVKKTFGEKTPQQAYNEIVAQIEDVRDKEGLKAVITNAIPFITYLREAFSHYWDRAHKVGKGGENEVSDYRKEVERILKAYEEALRRTWLDSILRKQQDEAGGQAGQPGAPEPPAAPEAAAAPGAPAAPAPSPAPAPEQQGVMSLTDEQLQRLLDAFKQAINVLQEAVNMLQNLPKQGG